MNAVSLVGNLTKDPEFRTTQSGTPWAGFTVAVQRPFADNDGNRQADFIQCVAWRKTAEFIGRHFKKGYRIGITGSIQTRTYDDRNGVKHYVTEVVCDRVEFVERKPEETARPAQAENETFQQVEDDGELPFDFVGGEEVI